MHERRKHARVKSQQRAQIEDGPRTIEAVTENIGRGGVVVRAQVGRPVSVGDEFRIRFPALGDVTATAVVRWVGKGDPPRIGLAFKTGFRARHKLP
jgi:hypothetical protein